MDRAPRLVTQLEYHISDRDHQEDYDDIVRLVAFICQTPIAAVSLLDTDRQWFKSVLGIAVDDIPRNSAFCAHTVRQNDLLVVTDATKDERFVNNPFVTGEPHARFYAGVPLVSPDGSIMGSLCVIDRIPRSLTSGQEMALRTLARQVSNKLELAWRVMSQDRLIAEIIRTEEDKRILAGAITSASEGIVIVDASSYDQPISYANPAFLTLTGYAEHEVLGHNCRFLQGPATDLESKRQLRQALDAGSACRVTLVNYRKDGSAFWNELIISPVLDAKGALTHFVGLQHDVTEHIEREQQIRDDNFALSVQKAQLETAVAKLLALTTTDPLTGLLNYRAFQVKLADEAASGERGGQSAAMAMLDLDGFRFFNGAYGHSAGDAVLRQVATRLKTTCSAGDAVARFGGDEFTILLQDLSITITPCELEARLQAGLNDLSYQPDGMVAAIPIKVSVGVALLPRYSTDWQVVVEMAEQRLRRAKTGGDMETEADRICAHAKSSLTGFSLLDALVTAVDNKDRYTRRHSEDVMEYSLMIALELGLDDATRETIAIAALLHDVGKLDVPDAILRKPGQLNDEEFEAVKQHPQMGAIMVAAVPGLEGTLDAVRHHHERWDGQGYPFGLQAEAIPLMARLMAVADAFSAMTSDRPYRKGMPCDKALSILRDGSGQQWDPKCVQAFIRAQTMVE